MGHFLTPEDASAVGSKGFFGLRPTVTTTLPFVFIPRHTGSTAVAISALGVTAGKAMLCDTNNGVFLSTDGGHTWTQKTDTPTGNVDYLIWENGVWIGGVGTGQIVRSTDDGHTWSTVDTTTEQSQAIISLGSSGAGHVVVVSGDNFNFPNYSVSSDDAQTFGPNGSINNNFYGSNILWDGAKYVTTVANGSSFTSLLTSPDGVTWTQSDFNTIEQVDPSPYNLALGSGLYVVDMGGSSTIRVSATAAGLTTATAVAVPNSGLGFGNPIMVLFDGTYFYSFDGSPNGVWRTKTPSDPTSWATGQLNFTTIGNIAMYGGYDSTNHSLIVTNRGKQLNTLRTA